MVFVLLTYGGWNEAAYLSKMLRAENIIDTPLEKVRQLMMRHGEEGPQATGGWVPEYFHVLIKGDRQRGSVNAMNVALCLRELGLQLMVSDGDSLPREAELIVSTLRDPERTEHPECAVLAIAPAAQARLGLQAARSGAARLHWVAVTIRRSAGATSHSVPARVKCRTSMAAGRPRLTSSWLNRPARVRSTISRVMHVCTLIAPDPPALSFRLDAWRDLDAWRAAGRERLQPAGQLRLHQPLARRGRARADARSRSRPRSRSRSP